MIHSLLIALLLLGSLAVVLFFALNLIVLGRATIPSTPHRIIVGNRDSNITSAGIPRIIWTYWHELPLPAIVRRCQDNWRQCAPDHEVRALNKTDITKWLAPESIPEYFHHLPPYRQSDWLRLQLLSRYGGVWVDASIILTQSLAWVHETQQQTGCEYVGFYIDRFTTRPDQPIVENWFMAATSDSKFIVELAREFNLAVELGERTYLNEISAAGKLTDIVQRIAPAEMQEYLIMHVAASALLDRERSGYKLALFRAEDTAFGFHSRLRWSKKLLHLKLALMPCPRQLPFLIKLRGGERKRIDEYLTKGWYAHGSLLAKFLKLHAPNKH